jgi:hypothetical protein
MANGNYTLEFEGLETISLAYTHPSEIGILVGLPTPGNYNVTFKGDQASGNLCHGGAPVFPVGNEDNFFETVGICHPEPTHTAKSEKELIAGIAVGAGVPLICVIVILACWMKRKSQDKANRRALITAESDPEFT